MKTSFCSIAFRNDKREILELIPEIAELGYNGIEIWGNHLTGGLSNVLSVKKAVREHGLEVPMISPYFDFTGSEVKWLSSLSVAKRYVQYAVVLGCPLIRVFTGVVGSGDISNKVWKTAVEGLKVISSIAEEQGISLALETHPGTLTDTVESTLRLIEAVGAPNLKVNLDIYHFWDATEDFRIPLDKLREHTVHVHAKNTNLSAAQRRSNPHLLLHDKEAAQEFFGIVGLREGGLPYEEFFRDLLTGGYDGFVSIEWFGDAPSRAARSELEYLRSIERLNRDEWQPVADKLPTKPKPAATVAPPVKKKAPKKPRVDRKTAVAAKEVEKVLAEAKAKKKPTRKRKKKVSENQIQMDLGEDDQES